MLCAHHNNNKVDLSVAEHNVFARKEPPAILVKTWLNLARSDEDMEVKIRAINMLKVGIGNEQAVYEYMNKHGIK